MGLILCVLGFASVALLIRRSLGDGLGLLLAIGSVYGIARANFFDGYTHFLFDASVVGAYLGAGRRLLTTSTPAQQRLRGWVIALSVLAVFLILVSPFLDAQPVLVQFLGLRPAIFFVPLVLLGAAAGPEEMERLSRWAVLIVLVTCAVATAEYILGVERFFPMNEASNIIYLSKDVGEAKEFRIPSTFSSAHAYGAAMVGLIPLLVYRLERGGRWRILPLVAIACAALGVFASAARSPVIALAAVALGLAFRGLRNPGIRLGLVAAACALLVAVPRVSRFQRFETLSNVSYATARVEGSVNAEFIDTIVEYPVGRGLGSALGTSVPFFLSDQARPQVGMENEYVRIAVEEGIVGLALWVAFVLSIMAHNPLRMDRFGSAVGLSMWMVCLFTWIQGFVGTGMLAAIPGTAMLMLYMGVLAAQRPLAAQERSLAGGPTRRLAAS